MRSETVTGGPGPRRRLQGRTALVTGAGDGIGRAVARRFAAEGARVLVAEIDPETGGPTAERLVSEFGAQARFVQTDVTDREQVRAAVRTATELWGGVDILVNNAWGGGNYGRVENKTDEQLDRGFAMGYYGPFWAMQAVFPHMREQGWGRIVNMCSLNGVNAHMGTLEYNSAKEALRALTRTAAREWAPTGVVVNAVCPGAKSAAFRRVTAAHPELEAASDAANPMGRIGDAEADVAPVVVFLASEECRYMTGNTLFVDGGAHINGVAWAPDLDGGQA
ncbi:SDR family NAD(P)-dependent oxidoreductase [Streptosporangium carneum]|uniref:3-oxoacyl-ACP reductase n=1 Tax=Streptosporangium carneum TaxID=47481 RepID=A0A9W6MHT9_9ACTN|nr:SDR family oxidoreductase [Streptosporangium carneum]GLK14606.1 3-oxoacyl-ACP reductase [Streptosporangium carneum]